MKDSQIYILASMAILSPHTSTGWGRLTALMCMLFAVAFFILERFEGREDR